MRRRVLRSFGVAQRPVAWGMLVLGVVVAGTVIANIWRVPDKPSALLLALATIYQGFQAVMEVENELDSEASAES
jgi:hypothetical protein